MALYHILQFRNVKRWFSNWSKIVERFETAGTQQNCSVLCLQYQINDIFAENAVNAFDCVCGLSYIRCPYMDG